MRAVCWHGKHDMRVETVPDPKILNPRDAIVRISSTCICGSDLHLYNAYMPTLVPGDILGHEFMGEVVEVGPEVKSLAVGDRVVVPFTISCGNCHYCKRQLYALCDNSNPNAAMAEAAFGYSSGGFFGYTHLFGGYAGGQAEYARVPFADVGPLKVPESLTDDQAVMLADILPTAYQAVDVCGLEGGETVAIWGCGPVGLLTIKCAYLLGAGRVIALDRVPERLALAREAGAEVVNYEEVETITGMTGGVYEVLRERTGGVGPDACIDAVGLEAHGTDLPSLIDRAKMRTFLATDRPNVLRQAIVSCRKGGTVSIPGVYGGLLDKVPMGSAFLKGLTFKMGQTHVQRYNQPLLERVERGEIDPSFIVTHRLGLDDAPGAYSMFAEKQDDCIKVVLKP